MCVQFTPDEIELFHGVKHAFDPRGLLNPAKCIPTLHRCAEFGRMRVHGGALPQPGSAALLMTMDVEATTSGVDASDALIEQVARAVANRTALAIRAGGTKAWYGHRGDGETLDPRPHSGIVDYEPSELVVVARAGTSLVELEALLAANGQMLAFEPPHFSPLSLAPPITVGNAANDSVSRAVAASRRRATLGGCVVSGLSGPRRASAGALRDFVLGAKVIDGRGHHVAFGGRVMKNVAGYDVSRVLAGSLGTLGVVTEVALKVLPLPTNTVTHAFAMDQATALARLAEWGTQSVALSASLWTKGELIVRLEGSEAAVNASIKRIGGFELEADDANARWLAIREQTHDFFAPRLADTPLWRVALPPTTTPLSATTLAFTDTIVEWHGGVRWLWSAIDPAVVRDTAARLGGHATLWRASDETKSRHGVFAPLAPAVADIQRRLKATFDPDGIFNRGRMYRDF